MALDSGKKIVRQNWALIPMPDTVIARVNKLGSNHPKLLTFTVNMGAANEHIPDIDWGIGVLK